MIHTDEFSNTPVVVYGDGADAFVFYRVCPKCGGFVKPDDEANRKERNATCKKHGRVKMQFAGFAGDCGFDNE